MTRNQAINEILMQEPTFLPLAKSETKVNGHPTYICPECQNGTGKDGDGITMNPKASTENHLKWKCFKCGFKGDNIDLYQKVNDITEFREAVTRLCGYYGITIDNDTEAPSRSVQFQHHQSKPLPPVGNIGYGETGWGLDEELTDGKQSQFSFRGGSCGKADAPPKYVIEGFKREINQHEPEFYKTGWNKSSFERTKATADELEGLTTFQKLQVIFGNVDEVEALAGTQLFWDWFHDRESYEKKFDAIRIELEATSDFTQPRQPVKDKTTTQQTQGAKNVSDSLPLSTVPTSQEIAQQQDYSNFFLQANKNLSMTDYHRGISLETLNRFCVGFVPNWRHPKAPLTVPTSPRLIIPTSDSSYLARDTRENLTATQKKYSKSKVGAVNIFNSQALQNPEKPVFVVEGEFDALSIIDVGGEAVALGSTSMVGRLIETLKNMKIKPIQPLIISLDGDKAGLEATEKLKSGLESLNIPYFVYNIAKPYKDAKGKKPDRITNTLTINEKDVQLFLTGFDKLSGTLGISTHKLLVAGLASFADTNHIGLTEKGIELLDSPEYTISIPEREYATLCGYDVKEHPTSTTDETEREKKRAKMELDNFRKQIKRDLNILSHSRISWTELIKKKPRSFENIAIIGTTGIKNGYIKMTFDAEFIKYLLQIPVLMQYSTALLSVDNRKSTAYTIGLKMSEHYHMLQNHETRTASRLKVETLLECTELPSIEEVRKSKKSWTERIKEPFETALDELFQKGVISDWYYCKSKGKLLANTEAQNIPDFETWCSLNVEYTLKNPVDLSELIEKKRTEKEACKKKKAGRPRKELDSPTPSEPKRKRGRPKKTES